MISMGKGPLENGKNDGSKFNMNILIATLLAAPFLAGAPQSDPEAKTAVAEFSAVYNRKASTDGERIEAIKQLANTPHKKTGLVLQKLLRSHNRRVPLSHKMEAAAALAHFSRVKGSSLFAVNGLLSRNNLKNTRLRVALIQTIGALQQNQIQALRVLHKLAVSDDFAVAKAAIEVIPSFENRGSVKLLIDYLRKCERKPANVKVSLKFPRQPRKPKTKDVDPLEERRNIDVKITADDKQRYRYDLCYPALKNSLKSMTGLTFQNWKAWNNWWRSGGVYEKDNR